MTKQDWNHTWKLDGDYISRSEAKKRYHVSNNQLTLAIEANL